MDIIDLKHFLSRSCLEKANLDEDAANDIIDKAWQRDGLMLYYYKCPMCLSYHLTKHEPEPTRFKMEII